MPRSDVSGKLFVNVCDLFTDNRESQKNNSSNDTMHQICALCVERHYMTRGTHCHYVYSEPETSLENVSERE